MLYKCHYLNIKSFEESSHYNANNKGEESLPHRAHIGMIMGLCKATGPQHRKHFIRQKLEVILLKEAESF